MINIKNEDNQCFKWCVVRALNPVDKNPNRINKELIEQAKSLNWNGLKFPVDLKQIKIFENNNHLYQSMFLVMKMKFIL